MSFKMEHLISLGVLLIVIGFIIVFLGMFFGAKDSASKTKVAVGGFIGFIPFGWSNDKRLLYIILAVSLAMFIFWAVLQLRISNP